MHYARRRQARSFLLCPPPAISSGLCTRLPRRCSRTTRLQRCGLATLAYQPAPPRTTRKTAPSAHTRAARNLAPIPAALAPYADAAAAVSSHFLPALLLAAPAPAPHSPHTLSRCSYLTPISTALASDAISARALHHESLVAHPPDRKAPYMELYASLESHGKADNQRPTSPPPTAACHKWTGAARVAPV
ncbi:hypothetical protein B0H15DRAFT_958397 [Mycena belliarum]|uniref:Uncharacterized protein n=1 Tax=Mycena belliarum TaxID=1033014 RepID=A0AAD6XKM2_9AGAR|nr:hypothetical protein B0H15DRAFT_958397 [Mycena belliae]